MAIIQQIFCTVCKTPKQEMVGSGQRTPNVCSDCRSREATKKRGEHFATLDQLPIEDRLRRIEEWIYDYRSPRSIYEERF
jgi:hypothetical protein